MNTYEKNLEIIKKRLKESSPEFNNLQISGNMLIYNNQSFNLNEIDLETVLPNILPNISASALSDDTNKKDIEKQWEVIKKSDPNMKDITIFLNHRIDLNKDEEFINIRTSDGINHLFKNDKNRFRHINPLRIKSKTYNKKSENKIKSQREAITELVINQI